MRALVPNEYSTVLPLLETIRNQAVYALAVIDGTQQGSVYVNEGKQITSAFITSSGGFYGVAGDETNDAFVQDVIQYMNDESNHPDFLLWVSTPRLGRTGWMPILFNIPGKSRVHIIVLIKNVLKNSIMNLFSLMASQL